MQLISELVRGELFELMLIEWDRWQLLKALGEWRGVKKKLVLRSVQAKVIFPSVPSHQMK